MKSGYVYILASKKNGTLYVGVTNNIEKRMLEHKNCVNKDSFVCKYQVNKLVYSQKYSSINEAIAAEKYIKGKKRSFKIELVEAVNSEWVDLFEH